MRHASAGSTAEIGYLIRIPGVRSEQPYVAVDTGLVRVLVIRDIVDHILMILDYITVHIHMVHTVVTVFK